MINSSLPSKSKLYKIIQIDQNFFEFFIFWVFDIVFTINFVKLFIFILKIIRLKDMNFDEEDDADFISSQSSSKNALASLFESSIQPCTNESLKYRPPKQPQKNKTQYLSEMMFFSHVQAFK